MMQGTTATSAPRQARAKPTVPVRFVLLDSSRSSFCSRSTSPSETGWPALMSSSSASPGGRPAGRDVRQQRVVRGHAVGVGLLVDDEVVAGARLDGGHEALVVVGLDAP